MEAQQYFLDQNTGISYAIVPEAGNFDSLQTLVEVSSLLAAEQDQQYQLQVVEHQDDQERPSVLIERRSPRGALSPGPVLLDKEKRKRGNGAAAVRPCKVCSEMAGRHSYYGGEVCPSCRAFFRRSVQSGYNNSYSCVRDGNCSVTLKTRKNCQFCRYQLCLKSGMKTTWVLSEEERIKKFEGRKIKRRKGKNPAEDEEDDSTDDIPALSCKMISEDEMLEVTDLLRITGYYEKSKVNDMETSLIRDIIRMVAFKHALPHSGQQQLRNVLTRRFEKIAKKMTDFDILPYEDKKEILEKNIPLLVELQICTFFNPDLLWREQLTTLIGQEEVEKLDRKLKSLSVDGLDDLRIEYSDMFCSRPVQDSEPLLDIVRDIGSWPQDPYEYVLLCVVLLFCTDITALRSPHSYNTQNKFAALLHKYLNKKHQTESGMAVSRFAGGINMINKARHLNIILNDLRQKEEPLL